MANAASIEELRSLLSSEEFDFRFDCGVSQPAPNVSIGDKENIISAFTIHFSVSVCKAEIDQLVSGLVFKFYSALS